GYVAGANLYRFVVQTLKKGVGWIHSSSKGVSSSELLHNPNVSSFHIFTVDFYVCSDSNLNFYSLTLLSPPMPFQGCFFGILNPLSTKIKLRLTMLCCYFAST
ncbi:MAG TPA: hypothetical protein PLA06_06315, partial [Syntrophorhabdaceae bacterium]|nr:hypothetical protein [Syntrophorhabdaceae bacterium]